MERYHSLNYAGFWPQREAEPTLLPRYPITIGLLLGCCAAGWLAMRLSQPTIPTQPEDIAPEIFGEVNRLYRLHKFALVDHEDHELWRMVEKRHEERDQVLDRLPLEPGMVVADLGAGVGVYSFPLAERVGPEGRVIALDIESAALEALEARGVDRYGGAYPNVEPRLGTPDDPRLEPASVDMVYMAHLDLLISETLLAETELLMERVLLAMRPGASLVVLQWFREGDRIDCVVEHATRFGLHYEALHELHYDRRLRNTTRPVDHVSYLMIFRKLQAQVAP